MKRWVWTVLVVVAVAGACGGSGDSQESKAAPFTVPPADQVGQQFSNRGITLTVTAAGVARSIRLNESNFRPGSGYETYTDTPAGPGAKYVVIKTHIVNNAKRSLDLTCGLPIKTVLVDDMQRHFDPIQDLYKIEGNPECNSQLQPGFESDMTWTYRVPDNTHVRRWAFVDLIEGLRNANYTRVRIQVP